MYTFFFLAPSVFEQIFFSFFLCDISLRATKLKDEKVAYNKEIGGLEGMLLFANT